MSHRLLFLLALLLLLPGILFAQDWPDLDDIPSEIIHQHFTPTITAIRAGYLVDPESGAVAENQVILTRFDPRNSESEIPDVGPDVDIPRTAEIIDLSEYICGTHVRIQSATGATVFGAR